MLNADGWRMEPGQVVSDVTARLLRWMDRVQGGATLTVDEVADQVCAGLCELMDAQAGVVLARRAPDDSLLLMSAPGVGFEPLLTDFDVPRFGAHDLLSVLPVEPFWVAQAVPHLQVLVGELWDALREAATFARGANTPEARTAPVRTRASGAGALGGMGGGNAMSAAGAAAGGVPGGGVAPLFVAASDAGPDGATASGGAAMSSAGVIVGGEEASGTPSLAVPLRSLNAEGYGEITGLALLWITSADGLAAAALQAALEAAARQAGGWMGSAMRAERLGESYRNLGAVFANAIDAKDANRSGHSKAVSYYAATIAREMGLPEHEVERIEFAGLLHDIGKVAVPDAILKKNSPLTMDELEMIRAATIHGADWLREVDGLEEIALMVRHQGERFDGGGYPDGLSGDAIPLGARVLAVALRFSAMTKPRANRRAMSVVGGALESLAGDSGSSLDPRVVNAFMGAMGRTI